MRSFTVTSVWGIPIRVNVSLLVFIPVLAWLIGSGQQIELYVGIVDTFARAPLDVGALQAGATPWIIGTAAALGLFVSVTLHELGHSWVALRYGLDIDSITLWIFGGVASLRDVPREWDREFWIAVAGPITSVLVGAVCYAAIQVLPASLPVVVFVVGWLAVTNVVLAVFNMVPAFPMDGGRVLRALLARNRPYAAATRLAARIGRIFAVLFAVFGVVAFNPILILLALFLYGAAGSESRIVTVDDLLEGFSAGDVMDRDLDALPADEPLSAFVARMLRDRRTAYPVADDGGAIVGVVTLADVKGVPQADHDSTPISATLDGEPLRVAADADAFDTLVALNQGGVEYAIVEDAGGVVGTLSLSDFGSFLQFRQESGLDAPVRVAQ